MTNNHSQPDSRSRTQGFEKPSYELLFMTKKYGLQPNDVLETIELVGRNRAKVEDRLRELSKERVLDTTEPCRSHTNLFSNGTGATL